MRRLLTTTFACLVMTYSARAQAAMITYNEATGGDLSNNLAVGTSTSFGPIGPGDSLAVTGTIDSGTGYGTGPDGQDSFLFTTTTTATIGFSSLTLGTASDLVIFLYQEPEGSVIGTRMVASAPSRANLFGNLQAGTYGISLVPAGNAGTLSYTFIVNAAVPEPASFALASMGLAGAFVAARRRRGA